ncbi:two-component system, NtrC family, sensor kinase [Paucidesulfovibrio gracilis DSM 16080]|uniref:histidine kinase n=1 Tax=Paucidesulfovibrio gracilis DSM 16080 TaxID=1121449 RepID=A0A1T4W100_9BACT|nr:ATP-binding protein [Paucidesulfovibrio gracilis]SKA70920.1 two-component system, NtrC family, sensor kinase [Paucidesulfovibrio gracilis DSM 16080]
MDARGYGILRWKFIGVIVCFSLIPVVALGSFINSRFSRTYEEKVTSNLRIMIENKRYAVDMFLQERIAQVRNLAYTHTLSEMGDQTFLSELFGTIRTGSASFIDLGVIGSDGRHVAYAGPYDLVGANYADEDWFHQVTLKGVYVSDVFMGFRNYPHFIIAVLRRDGDQSWILRATIDSEVFNRLVQSVQLGRRGDAYLVNGEGVLQTPSRFGPPALERCFLPVEGINELTILDLPSHERRELAGIVPLRTMDWKLVISEDPSEEMSPLLTVRSIALFLVLGGVVVIFAGAFLTTRSIVAKVERADREKAAADVNLMQSSKLAALGKMAAGVAHEVNNPLTLIREAAGWITDLLTDEDPECLKHFEEIEEAARDIDRHVERAKTVTHRMLGFARRMEPVQENVDVGALVEGTISFLANEAMHRNIIIQREYAPDLPLINTDATQVQQVVLNLLENAIDAVGRDGSIQVRTGTGSGEVSFSVSDTGPGIDPQLIHKIFDPFFSTKKVGEGTGLGLSITYGIVERLGGRINAESEPGRGATFTVHLPA